MIFEKPPGSHYDVVILGSGPAGITTALALAEQSTARIALVETGLLKADEKIQTLSQVQLTGDLQQDYFPMHTQRCFGGSSTIWGGFCAVLEERAFLAQSWPIAYSELERWYPQAALILELPENVYKRSTVAIQGSPHIVYKPFYLSPPVRFNQKYHAQIAEHSTVDLILNHTCSALLKQDDQVFAAQLRNSLQPAAAPITITADHFVLACGGVGNPRLLQLSGIGEQSPVGVGLMEHPHLYGVGEVILNKERIAGIVEENAAVIHALQLSDTFCLENDLLSFSADFNLSLTDSGPLLGQTAEILRAPMSIRAEIAPHPGNRVSLGEQTDYLNQPVSRVDFHFRYEEMANRCWELFARELVRTRLGRASSLAVELSPDGGGHLIGTTPMGRSAADSVVDANCRVHATRNLYVAGSSVFPAGGASNPTYTIVAMSLRLAEHLAKIMKGDVYG